MGPAHFLGDEDFAWLGVAADLVSELETLAEAAQTGEAKPAVETAPTIAKPALSRSKGRIRKGDVLSLSKGCREFIRQARSG